MCFNCEEDNIEDVEIDEEVDEEDLLNEEEDDVNLVDIKIDEKEDYERYVRISNMIEDVFVERLEHYYHVHSYVIRQNISLLNEEYNKCEYKVTMNKRIISRGNSSILPNEIMCMISKLL